MCKSHSPKRIDKCMIKICWFLDEIMEGGGKVVACCCGHKRYNPSIVIRTWKGGTVEIFAGITLKRKKRFYVKDKQGYYYIPETLCH